MSSHLPQWFVAITFLMTSLAMAADRPNILWITCEDISPYLGCYECPEAQTPHLDQLAEQGVRYTHAYANAPVCAVARSTLLTGMYATTIGTHQMRSDVLLPTDIPAYPRIFREAGYYCTNNSKKDYNSNLQRDPTLWDESSGKAHYKNRGENQPFFAVFNITVTHESQLAQGKIDAYVSRQQIPAVPRNDPSTIQLPPYHPDLPAIRNDWARLHDLITHMDMLVGERLRELNDLGLADDTIVFFYSDHGGQLARSKRFIYNVGTQVPLIVRVPAKWQHLAPTQPGSTCDRLVSFVDFPKTVLSLCDLPVPSKMQGSIFLGPGTEAAPDRVFFYRDRMAERYDFSRAVTDGRWYFIRNFIPHRPRGRDSRYGYEVQANWGAWQQHCDAGKCNDTESQFFEPKPVVELFDTDNDPWQVCNLADAPEHQERLRAFSDELDRWMIDTLDIGVIPEPLFYDLVGPGKPFPTLYEYAQSDQYPINRLLRVAKEASAGQPESLAALAAWLTDANPIARHWAAYGCFRETNLPKRIRPVLTEMMNDDAFAANRIIAAQALARHGEVEAAFAAIHHEIQQVTNRGYVFLAALNAWQYGHCEDYLTKECWQALEVTKPPKENQLDATGFQYGQRIVKDALAIWPKHRRID